MDNTRIKLTPALKTRIATGHDKDGKRTPYYNLQVMAGAGALCSTANDLLKYLSANLGLSQTHLKPLMDKMQVIRHTESPRWGRTAMPWFDEAVYNPPGSELLGHGGGTPGFSTFVGFDKKQRRGVVVLSSQRTLHSGCVGWAILQGMPLTRESGTLFVREIVGIGTALSSDEQTGMLLITKVFPKSPAARAGLSAGFVIQQINDVSVKGKSLEECIGMVGGPIGTKVRLEVFDPKRKESRTVELTKQRFLTVPG
jgi:CubicO group peptidase (beta-lactamase class C family)